jgi:predicted nucleotide-binding protein
VDQIEQRAAEIMLEAFEQPGWTLVLPYASARGLRLSQNRKSLDEEALEFIWQGKFATPQSSHYILKLTHSGKQYLSALGFVDGERLSVRGTKLLGLTLALRTLDFMRGELQRSNDFSRGANKVQLWQDNVEQLLLHNFGAKIAKEFRQTTVWRTANFRDVHDFNKATLPFSQILENLIDVTIRGSQSSLVADRPVGEGSNMGISEALIEDAMYKILEAAEAINWEVIWLKDHRVVQVKSPTLANITNSDGKMALHMACDRMLNEKLWMRHDSNNLYIVTESGRKALTNKRSGVVMPDDAGVFIVHGHDKAARDAVENFIRKLDLEPIMLVDQTSRGSTVIEKFERESSRAHFAVVLLTPDDVGCAKDKYDKEKVQALMPRARQNVVLELGFFYAKLGRGKVAALQKGQVEKPSDVHGIVYISMDGAEWQIQLAKEMRSAGLNVDLNRL